MPFHKYADDAEIVADYLPEFDLTNEADAAVVARRNEAVSAFVDSYTGRRPGYFLPASATATPKQIRGENRNFLRVPVHAGAATVSGVSTLTFRESSKNGWLYVNQPDGLDIESDEYVSDYSRFWSSGRIYIVSARWGYEQTPAEIIEAVKMIVGDWVGKGRGILGQITPAGFLIERDAPPSALTLLQPFIKGEYEID